LVRHAEVASRGGFVLWLPKAPAGMNFRRLFVISVRFRSFMK
jgi:hypothetical protein